MWLAGGGVKPRHDPRARPTSSASRRSEDKVHVHDLQATILHLLGLDHTEADVPLPGPRLPPDRRGGQPDQGGAVVTKNFLI